MLRITRDDDARVIRLEGELTAHTLPLIEESLALQAPAGLRVDLEGVRWIDAAAAARLLALREAGAALTGCTPFVARLLAAGGR